MLKLVLSTVEMLPSAFRYCGRFVKVDVAHAILADLLVVSLLLPLRSWGRCAESCNAGRRRRPVEAASLALWSLLFLCLAALLRGALCLADEVLLIEDATGLLAGGLFLVALLLVRFVQERFLGNNASCFPPYLYFTESSILIPLTS
ncbi:MAG: hypothetical protein ACLS3C_02090 [Oscillospiraceae bacterium]